MNEELEVEVTPTVTEITASSVTDSERTSVSFIGSETTGSDRTQVSEEIVNLAREPSVKITNPFDADVTRGSTKQFENRRMSRASTKSSVSRRRTIAFDANVKLGSSKEENKKTPRPSLDFTGDIQERRISPDVANNLDMTRESIINPQMSLKPENIFGEERESSLGPVVSFASLVSSVEEEEEPDFNMLTYISEFDRKSSKKPINREDYENEYRLCFAKSHILRRKNRLLHKKVSEYYQKKKMLRVFEEPNVDLLDNLVEKYEDKVLDYGDLQSKCRREKEAVDNEFTDMTFQCADSSVELVKSFAAMQSREQDIGHGLIYSKTGKPMSNKVVDRLVFRQKAKSEEIAKIRLAYIKRRDKVKEIENKIKALETIGGTLHLMDFEQLRMENQTYADKIEERDEDIMRLRDRYSHAMQAVAHIREKINISERQNETYIVKKRIEEGRVSGCRERLNKLKIQRDKYRSQADKLKANLGILTSTKLLLDMEKGVYETIQLREKLDNVKAINDDYHEKLFNIRTKMKNTTRAEKQKIKVSTRTSISDKHAFQRPTMVCKFVPKTDLMKLRTQEVISKTDLIKSRARDVKFDD